VTDAVRAERGIQSDHGALIYDIPDEMQQATGLKSGDVVLQITAPRSPARRTCGAPSRPRRAAAR